MKASNSPKNPFRWLNKINYADHQDNENLKLLEALKPYLRSIEVNGLFAKGGIKEKLTNPPGRPS